MARATDQLASIQDEEAEKYVVGALLWGVRHPEFEPQLLFHQGRRALAEAMLTMQERDLLLTIDPYAPDALGLLQENSSRVIHFMSQVDWPLEGLPASQCLADCVAVCANPCHLDHYLPRLQDAATRRACDSAGDELHRKAMDLRQPISEALSQFSVPVCGTLHSGLETVLMSEVEPQPVEWLWPDWLPLGKVVLISGHPGQGKSLLTIDLASRLTAGTNWPDQQAVSEPGGVLLVSCEDDPHDTLRPRLDAAEANPELVKLVSGTTERGRKRGFSMARDVDRLRHELTGFPDCRLAIIDLVSSYLQGVDSHSNADVRGVLTPLADLASEFRVTILLVNHLNKACHQDALLRSSGSTAFVALARAAYLVGADPEDPDGRYLANCKNNLGPDNRALRFRIQGDERQQPRVSWEPTVHFMRADDLLRGDQFNGCRSKREQAKEWLRTQLAAGPAPVVELQTRCREAGISLKTLQRAAQELEIDKDKEEYRGKSIWSLPEGSELASIGPHTDS